MCVRVLCAQPLSHVQVFITPWTVACQAPLSMGFSRQGYWSGVPFPIPGDFPNPGIKPASALQADSSLLSHQANPEKLLLEMNSLCACMLSHFIGI